MKSFFVGLLVVALVLILSGVGILLLPLFIVLGFFLKIFVGLFVVLFVIWLIGKVTLLTIERLSR